MIQERDGRTDRQTDGRTDSAWRYRPRVRIASRGKNYNCMFEVDKVMFEVLSVLFFRTRCISNVGVIVSTSMEFVASSVGHSPLEHIPQTISLSTLDISPAVKAKIWELALTHTPDPNRSTPRGPNPNRLTGRGISGNWHWHAFLTLTDLPLSILYTLTVDRFIL